MAGVIENYSKFDLGAATRFLRAEGVSQTDIVFNILIFDDHKTLCNSLRNRRINNYDKLKENNFKIIFRKKTFYMYFMCLLCKKLYI
jgi:hypothetical protein